MKKRLNADLNASVNIAHRVGYEIVFEKVESYKVTHNGVRPVTPYRRGQDYILQLDPVIKGGEGLSLIV